MTIVRAFKPSLNLLDSNENKLHDYDIRVLDITGQGQFYLVALKSSNV